MDWRAVVRDDLRNERPTWPFSCYAHQRSGQNDLTGDYSFEEVGTPVRQEYYATMSDHLLFYVCVLLLLLLCAREPEWAVMMLTYAEQVRWAEMQAVRAGRSAASIVADFNVAKKALEQQWQV